MAVEFRVGKTGAVEREQREQAALLAEAMASRAGRIGKLSVEFRVGNTTPATATERADARMREIRQKLEASSDDDFEAPLYNDFSGDETQASPQGQAVTGGVQVEFSASVEMPPAEAAGRLPEVADPFDCP